MAKSALLISGCVRILVLGEGDQYGAVSADLPTKSGQSKLGAAIDDTDNDKPKKKKKRRK